MKPRCPFRHSPNCLVFAVHLMGVTRAKSYGGWTFNSKLRNGNLLREGLRMDGCSAAFYTDKRKAVGAVESFGVRQMIRYTHIRLKFYSLEKSGFNIQHGVSCYSDVFWIVFRSCHVELNSAPWVRYDLIIRLLSTPLEMACGISYFYSTAKHYSSLIPYKGPDWERCTAVSSIDFLS